MAFDIERIKSHLDNYTKDKNPTKITCYEKISDSNDINRKDPVYHFLSYDVFEFSVGFHYPFFLSIIAIIIPTINVKIPITIKITPIITPLKKLKLT